MLLLCYDKGERTTIITIIKVSVSFVSQKHLASHKEQSGELNPDKLFARKLVPRTAFTPRDLLSNQTAEVIIYTESSIVDDASKHKIECFAGN